MALANGQEKRRRGSTRIGIAVTVVLHGAFVTAVGIAHSRPVKKPSPDRRHFVAAEMIALGHHPDDSRLPAVTQPPHLPKRRAALNVTDDPDARPAGTNASRPTDEPPEGTIIGQRMPSRMIWGPGAPNESELGTSNRNAGERYLAEITGLLRQNYFLVAGLTMDEVPTPPEIRFRFTDDGTIFDVNLSRSSADPLVDDACLNAARLTRQLPPPPADFRARRVAVSCEK